MPLAYGSALLILKTVVIHPLNDVNERLRTISTDINIKAMAITRLYLNGHRVPYNNPGISSI